MPYKPCRGGAPCILLLVENEPTFCELFEQWIKEVAAASFAVRSVATLEAMGVELARAEKVDAVILDLGLEGSEGIDTLDRAVAITQYRVPIIVLTGGDVQEDEARAHGAYALIRKTDIAQQTDRAMFLRIVRDAIDKQRLIDQVFDLVERSEAGADGEALKKIEELKVSLRRLAMTV